jgi:plastocyanin
MWNPPTGEPPMIKHSFVAAVLGCLLVTPVFAADHVVSQKNKKFSPGDLTIKAGDTITFANDEKRHRHNVYTKDESFKYVKVKIQKPGQRNTITVNNTGEFTLLCALHPKMIMKVKVVK